MNTFKINKDRAAATIEMTTCEFFNVPLEDIKRRTRKANVVQARHVMWYALNKVADISFISIARRYGMDHTTVMHGVYKCKYNMAIIRILPDYIKYLQGKVEKYQTGDKTGDNQSNNLGMSVDNSGISRIVEKDIPESSTLSPQFINSSDF